MFKGSLHILSKQNTSTGWHSVYKKIYDFTNSSGDKKLHFWDALSCMYPALK